jgi:hypothetical protein
MTFDSVERVPTSDVPLPVQPVQAERADRNVGQRNGLAAQHELERITQARTAAGGLLQRACSCGGVPGADGMCAECREQHAVHALAMSGSPDEDYSDLEIHLSQSPGPTGPADVGTAEPAAATCPTSIKVAEVIPVALTTEQIGKGVRSGWGAITRMEVSGAAKTDWAGTRVKEVLSSGTNDCEKGPACANTSAQAGNAGSTWTVGEASPAFSTTRLGEVIPAQAAKKNSFFDIHVQGGGANWCAANGTCSRSCTQHFECGGQAFGPTFDVSWSFSSVSRKDPKGDTVSICAGTLKKGVAAETK